MADVTCSAQVEFVWEPWPPHHFDVEATCHREVGHDGSHAAWLKEMSGTEVLWTDGLGQTTVVTGLDFV